MRQIVDAYKRRFGTVYREESPPLLKNEDTDNYDTIDIDTDSSEDRYAKTRMEDSSEEQPEPISRTIAIELLVCIMSFVGRGLCLNSVGPTLIDLRQIASITMLQSAWIFVSQSLGFLIGSVLAKVILQRFNNELALAVCLSIQAISTALIPAFASIVMMCFMFIGQGFAIGVVGIGVCSTCIRLGGKTRNGMFLQSVYLGVSIGSVLGPFIARPFLSTLAKHTVNHQMESPEGLGAFISEELSRDMKPGFFEEPVTETGIATTANISHIVLSNITNLTTTPDTANFTQTHVHFYYAIIALIISIPTVAFFLLYIKRDDNRKHKQDDDAKAEALSVTDCTIPLTAAISLMFVQCLLYFGIQDTYSNLLTSFAVLGPLHLPKVRGVYLTSLFWASMCFGRLNGIWIAKVISPFKMLLMDMLMAFVAAIGLMSFADKSSEVLWGFTVLLGLSFATVNGATVSWAASHLPDNNYILSIIMVGRCAGLLLLPTTVTALFKTCGAMTLMYGVFLAVIFMLAALICAQIIAYRYGVKAKLHSRSEMTKVLSDNNANNF